MAKEVKVVSYVRLRPLTLLETRSQFIEILENNTRIIVDAPTTITSALDYSFNYIFPEKTTQVEVYNKVVHPLIKEVVSGYNCTVFAYGQTGSGKTYTISGPQTVSTMVEDVGIVPRAINDLYDQLEDLKTEFSVQILFLELYNEKFSSLVSEETDITLLTDLYDNVHVKGVNWNVAPDRQKAFEIFTAGSLKKQMAKTEMNLTSSRSHTIFSVTVSVTESNGAEDTVRMGKFNLIDLAGSENLSKYRLSKTDEDTTSNIRALETKKINQSLYSLGRVITAIVDNHDHVPYRGSKLTHFLKDSLGGNSKTVIIGTISLSTNMLSETMNTLRYTCAAQQIRNQPTKQVQVTTSTTFMKVVSQEILELSENLHAQKQGDGFFIPLETEQVMKKQLSDLQCQIKELNTRHNALNSENEQNLAILDNLLKEKEVLVEENQRLKEISTQSEELNQKLKQLKLTNTKKTRHLQNQIKTVINEEIAFVHRIETYAEISFENISLKFKEMANLVLHLQEKCKNMIETREDQWRVTEQSVCKLNELKHTLKQNNMKAVDISSKWEAALEHLEKEIASILLSINKGERDVQMARIERKKQLDDNLSRVRTSLSSLQQCLVSGLNTIQEEAREAVKIATNSKVKTDVATQKILLIKQMVTDLEAHLHGTSETVDCASKKVASLNNHSEKLCESSLAVFDTCTSDLAELHSTDFKDEATIHMQLMTELATNLQTMSITSTKKQAKSIETLIPDIQAVSDVTALISSTEKCLKTDGEIIQQFQVDLSSLQRSIEMTDKVMEESLRKEHSLVITQSKSLEDFLISADTAFKDLREKNTNLDIPSGSEQEVSPSPSEEFPSTSSDIAMSEEEKENANPNNITTTKRISKKTIKNSSNQKIPKRSYKI